MIIEEKRNYCIEILLFLTKYLNQSNQSQSRKVSITTPKRAFLRNLYLGSDFEKIYKINHHKRIGYNKELMFERTQNDEMNTKFLQNEDKISFTYKHKIGTIFRNVSSFHLNKFQVFQIINNNELFDQNSLIANVLYIKITI